jgi:hypothetical protein
MYIAVSFSSLSWLCHSFHADSVGDPTLEVELEQGREAKKVSAVSDPECICVGSWSKGNMFLSVQMDCWFIQYDGKDMKQRLQVAVSQQKDIALFHACDILFCPLVSWNFFWWYKNTKLKGFADIFALFWWKRCWRVWLPTWGLGIVYCGSNPKSFWSTIWH